MARPKINTPKTERDSRMWKLGHDAAFELLVTVLEERGHSAFVLDAIEANIRGEVLARFNAVFAEQERHGI